jgi:hypothetical protein
MPIDVAGAGSQARLAIGLLVYDDVAVHDVHVSFGVHVRFRAQNNHMCIRHGLDAVSGSFITVRV